MKKLHLLLLSVTLCLFSACHNDIWDAIDGLDSRVTKLEELCKEMNTNITSLQTIVDVLQANDYITGVVEIKKDGEVIVTPLPLANTIQLPFITDKTVRMEQMAKTVKMALLMPL